MSLNGSLSVARVYTSLAAGRYLSQIPLWWQSRDKARWALESMRIRIVANDKGSSYHSRDVETYSRIVRSYHYLGRWPVRKGSKILAYLVDLEGIQPGPAGAAGMVMIALQPSQCAIARSLNIHPCERLELVRCWRADDLDSSMAPWFSPSMLSRVIRGHQASNLQPLADVWNARKLTNGLTAPARLLVTHADPAVGHDGGLYRAAGAVFCGTGEQGKLRFAWALDPVLRQPLLQAGSILSA